MESMIDVTIIGAGVSGLACARKLCEAGLNVRVVDASDGVGGRIRTDSRNGFLLDRGFQVLLTAYPEARRVLNFESLRLRRFYPGALVRHAGRWHRIADPWRRPLAGALSAFNPIGSFVDKLRVARLRLSGARRYESGPELDTLAALRQEGFSDAMVERFMRPFLGGVFLEKELGTTARKFASVWRHFAAGDIAVPAGGMEQIPRQLAGGLADGVVQLETRVEALCDGGVQLAGGRRLTSRSVVVATEGPEASRLLGGAIETPEFNGVDCLYFDAAKAPISEATLVLNGDGAGPINNLAVMSEVSSEYAPEGRSLISVSVLGFPASGDPSLLERDVRSQLLDWFGEGAREWQLLTAYRLKQAIPFQSRRPEPKPRIGKGIYLCGDHCDVASLDAAMVSGRLAASCVLEDRGTHSEPC